ncbi:hypothetical protein ACUM5Y_06755 [Marinomonas dokdonensis]|uniref:hypothetical protein n=1 Tax=Marinomonas dokdonensis TaxID=328224 RepID=UPI004055779B
MANFKLHFAMLGLSLLSTSLWAQDSFKTQLEAMSLSDINRSEAALIAELKERTEVTYQPVQTSYYAISQAKRDSDKKNLVEHTLELINAKLSLMSRVNARKESPGYNDKAYVVLNNITVKSSTKHDFRKASAQGITLVKGELIKSDIFSGNVSFPLNYRTTYSEKENVYIQGVKPKADGSVDFDVKYDNHTYHVHGVVTISKNGWN